MARFRDDDLAAVALPHGPDEGAQGQPPRIVVGQRRDAPVDQRDAPLPLVGPVVVDADDIEVLAAAAELRHEPAAQHVPALEDEALVEVARLLGKVRPAGRRRHPAQRIDIDDPRFRAGEPDGVDAGDGGAR